MMGFEVNIRAVCNCQFWVTVTPEGLRAEIEVQDHTGVWVWPYLTVCRESPVSRTTDTSAWINAMNPASSSSLPCAVKMGFPAESVRDWQSQAILQQKTMDIHNGIDMFATA